MARYVTSGAQYNPFDFNAMWKSAEAATQAHYAQGAQFAAMAEQMSPYEALKYNPVDANDYAQVQQYNKQLEDSLAKFQKNGLSGGSFQSFLQLSKDYATKIKPLEIGMKQRAEYDNVVLQMKAKDPTIEIPKLGREISLRDFAAGSVAPQFVSGALVQQQVAQIAAKFAQQSGDQIDIQSLNKYYDVIRQNTGLKFEEVLAYMKDPNMNQPKALILNSIVQGVLNSTNGFNELPQEAKARITQQAMNGAWSAVGAQQNNVTKSNYFDEQANSRGWAQIKMMQDQQSLENELTLSKIAANYARANKTNNSNDYQFTPAGPIKPYASTTGQEKVDAVRKDYDEFLAYKKDPKNNKRPKAARESGLTDADYEAQVTNAYHNTVLENQRYVIEPNSIEAKKAFYDSFAAPVRLNMPIIKRGGGSTTTLRNILDNKDKNQTNGQYLLDNFSLELDYGTADPSAGLILRNNNTDQVYYIPYKTFGTYVNGLAITHLNAIKNIKNDPTISNDEKQKMISSHMGAILDDIYSTTKEPPKESYKEEQTQDNQNNLYGY